MEFLPGSKAVLRTKTKFTIIGWKIIPPEEYERKNQSHLNKPVEIEAFFSEDLKLYAKISKSKGIKIGSGVLQFNSESDKVGPFNTLEDFVKWLGPVPYTTRG